MGVPASDRISGPYDCTGGETLIPYDFKAIAATDLAVWRLRGGGETRLVLNTDYTVSGVGLDAGGNVTLLTAALDGDSYVVEGERPAVRTIDLSAERANKASALNSEYDSLQVQLSEVRTQLGRTLRRSRFTTDDPDSQLPTGSGYPYIDSEGNLTLVQGGPGAGGSPGISIPVTIEQGGTGADDAAEARNNLGLGALATRSQVSVGDLHPSIAAALPKIGDIIESPDGQLRAGCLWADGQAVSRTTYAALFARYGTRFGSGDGSTTFNLPDRNGRSPRGIDNGKGRDIGAAPIAITNATNNGSGLIRITVGSTANLSTGRTVHIDGVGGVTNANGTRTITVISTTTFDLQGSTFAGTYTSGGAVHQRVPNAPGGVFGDQPGSVQDDMLQAHQHTEMAPGGGYGAGSGGTQVSSLGGTQTTTGGTGRLGGETTAKNFSTRWMVLADLQAAAAENLTLNAWHFTLGVPSSSLGINGDRAINTLTGDVYAKAAGAWSLTGLNLKAASYAATSTTSLAIGTGSKTFAVPATAPYLVGDRVRAKSAANPSRWMEGLVTSNSGGSLVVNVDLVGVTGTHADWNISLTGEPGDVTPAAVAARDAAQAAATAAASSQTAAATSATNAASSGSAAATSATNAASSASAASTSATAAASSQTAAAGSATSASTSATNAATSATSAATSETNAATHASGAATSATNAATSATSAANAAAGLSGTSTSSVALGTGTLSLTTQAGKQFAVGQWVQLTRDASNYAVGQVASYNSSTGAMTIDVASASQVVGSGTYTSWTIVLSGRPGPTGPAGSLDVGALSGVAPASNDKIVIGDTSNSNATAYVTPADLPISTATQTALDAKANLASPSFTGTPTAPTAATNTNTTQIATTEFVQAQVTAQIATLDVSVHKGSIDCSGNPNYPAAERGDVYRVSVSGKIGGASGPNVESGDMLICNVDASASGTHATVGANWGIVQVNLDGAVIGPTSSTNNDFARYSGTTGKLLGAGVPAGIADNNVLTAKNSVASGEFARFTADGVEGRTAAELRSDANLEPQGELLAQNAQTGTTYTLVLADKGKQVSLSNAGAITMTVPPNSSVAFPTLSRIELWQEGAGQVTIAAGAGVTIRSAGSRLKLTGQYSAAVLTKVGTDTWQLVGDISA